MASALLAYFLMKPSVDIRDAEGTASVGDLEEMIYTEKDPVSLPESVPELRLDGFSGMEAEIESISGSM